jgi:hypothetical protein
MQMDSSAFPHFLAGIVPTINQLDEILDFFQTETQFPAPFDKANPGQMLLKVHSVTTF